MGFSEIHLTPNQFVDLCNMKTNNILPHGIILKALQMLIQEKHTSTESLVEEKRWLETMRDPER